MGERKVLNKYIPADFDPSLVPRGNKLSKKDGTVPVRMMLPFTIQCSTCHTFLYRGRKFNSKKEPMGGPDGRYLGIQRFRFYIKCTHCSRTLSFLTDPQNTDYEMETGGTRNYEVHKDKAKTEDEVALEKEEEEKEDPMKALENRVLDSQQEMADLDNLAEIQAMNRRHVQLLSAGGGGGGGTYVNAGMTMGTGIGANAAPDFAADTKALLDAREAAKKARRTGEDTMDEGEEELNEHGITKKEEELIKLIQFGKKKKPSSSSKGMPYSATVMRLSEEDEKREEQNRKQKLAPLMQQQQEMEQLTTKAKEDDATKATNGAMPVIRVKRRRLVPPPLSNDESNKTNGSTAASMKKAKPEPSLAKVPPPRTTTQASSSAGSGGLASLLGAYGSDSDSD